MKFTMECRVESEIHLAKEISATYSDRTYSLSPGEDGLLTRIAITANDVDTDTVSDQLKIDFAGERVSLTLNWDSDFFDDLIRDFQYLESSLSFSGGLTRVEWGDPRCRVTPETDQERERINILELHVSRKYPTKIYTMDTRALQRMVQGKQKYGPLIVIKGFWREGREDFDSFRYIHAFYNFYFVLEGLYAGGKTRTSAVESEFRKSRKLDRCLDWLIDSLNQPEYTSHRDRILARLKTLNRSLDKEGLIRLIIHTRGSLHHFVGAARARTVFPDRAPEHESLAWMMLGLSTRVIAEEVLAINRRSGSLTGK